MPKLPNTSHTTTQATDTPATGTATNRHTESVIIPLNVYEMDILDEIETIKLTLNNLAGVFSALHYANLSDWQIKSIAGNALYSATDLHYSAECLLDKASEYAVLATTLPATTTQATDTPAKNNMILVKRDDLTDIQALLDELITGLFNIENALYANTKSTNDKNSYLANIIHNAVMWQSQTANNISCYLEEMLKNNQ